MKKILALLLSISLILCLPISVFAAETQDKEKNAAGKLIGKHDDMVVANDVTKKGAGFGTDTNIATLITAKSV